jgi:hypothetical protein
MSKEENAALPAMLQARAQVGLGAQNTAHDNIVLQNHFTRFAPTIPLRAIRKMLLDLYCKKDRLSLMMFMYVGKSSSYSTDTSVSSRKTGTALSHTHATSEEHTWPPLRQLWPTAAEHNLA